MKIVNLTGQYWGRWHVLSKSGVDKWGNCFYLVRNIVTGEKRLMRSNSIQRMQQITETAAQKIMQEVAKPKRPWKIDRTGEQYGDWLVLAKMGKDDRRNVLYNIKNIKTGKQKLISNCNLLRYKKKV